jgi:hypothetical protein
MKKLSFYTGLTLNNVEMLTKIASSHVATYYLSVSHSLLVYTLFLFHVYPIPY